MNQILIKNGYVHGIPYNISHCTALASASVEIKKFDNILLQCKQKIYMINAYGESRNFLLVQCKIFLGRKEY